eukprot:403359439
MPETQLNFSSQTSGLQYTIVSNNTDWLKGGPQWQNMLRIYGVVPAHIKKSVKDLKDQGKIVVELE